MPAYASESDLEQAALSWFADLGYEILDHENLDPDSVYQERSSVEQVVLEGRLRAAMERLNPEAPPEAFEEALRELRRNEAPTLIQNNQAFHQRLTQGITVEVPGKAGGVRGVLVRLIDPKDPEANDWMVTRQLDVVDRGTGTGHMRRPDLVVFVNGLPLAVLELKSPSSASAGVDGAYHQLLTYAKDIPSLFVTNCALVISDDVHALIGPLLAPRSRFAPWRTIGGEGDAPAGSQPLQVLIAGVFAKAHFLDLCQSFITFAHDRDQGVNRLVKKLAGYHQFHAVRLAVEKTAAASGEGGDRRVGVVWHTQGSGKSLTMVFYAGKLVRDPRMENPTLVVLTDRNDLDDQLFATFAEARALLRQAPEQARDREHLRALLRASSGGVYFTTAQKFLPEGGERMPALSERRNIVVIADEAHRSQYGFDEKVDPKTGKKTWGFAVHMRDALPGASFIGFTGTPVDLKDRSTVRVFGNTISVYDIRRAVEDRATVPIYYEARQTPLDLDEAERPHIDPAFEEVTEGEEAAQKEALKSEWSAVEAVAGTTKRLALVAKDLVPHFEKRLGVLEGKAMVVCMSRRICVELYEAIRALRPDWHAEDDDEGALKVVMTGSAADGPEIATHVRTKARRARLAERFKDPSDPLKLVIVRDMWLTGFDAPCLHTLYVDKPMQGHNLLQAIARVNRVFGDKPGGLVVDYFGLEESLKQALKAYTESGGEGRPTTEKAEAIGAMWQALTICRGLFQGFDDRAFFEGGPAERLAVLPRARDHVLGLCASAKGEASDKPSGKGKASDKGERRGLCDAKKRREPDGYDRFMEAVRALSSAFSLAMPNEACESVRSEVAFFQAVKAGLTKLASPARMPSQEVGHAVRQIVENAILPGQVVDVFDAAGVPKPNLSILSEGFLDEIRKLPLQNLAAALLRRLLEDEVARRSERSVIQGRSFAELLEQALLRYRNRSIDSAAVIEELIDLAGKMVAADRKAGELSLSREEMAFYEALADNRSAVEKLGDATLAGMARELTALVRKNATLDWTHKRNVQAKLRSLVKRLLREHGYPPDGAEKAAETVLEQAKLLGINVVEGGSEATGDLGSF
jgi:type I restriction enzyme, R subunit